MKNTPPLARLKQTLCVILILAMISQCLPMAVGAAQKDVWSETQILDFFSNNMAHYNDTGLLLKPDTLAALISGVLGESGSDYDIYYNETESTSTLKKYTLMQERENVAASSLLYHLQMELDPRANTVRTLQVHTRHTDWSKQQLAKAMDAFALIYERIHGNMTEAKRAQFVTSRNLAKTDNGYCAEGVMDGLYYKLSFDQETVCLTIMSHTFAEIPPVSESYKPQKIYNNADEFEIRTGELSRNDQGYITLDVELVNKSKHPLSFSLEFVCISGYPDGCDVPPSFYTEISPGNTKAEQLHIEEAVLAACGITEVYGIGLYLIVTDLTTGENVYNYYNWANIGKILVRPEVQKYDAVLFQNDIFTLSVIGFSLNADKTNPHIFLKLENGVYALVYMESVGNCIIGKQEYDFSADGCVDKYDTGVAVASVVIDPLDKPQTLEFDIQITTWNHKPLISGRVTVKLDQNGNILNVTSKMKENPQYSSIMEEY